MVAISIIVPYFASELIEQLLGKNLKDLTWPKYNPELAQVSEVEIAIQVNGKLRGTLKANKDCTQEEIEPRAKDIIAKWLENKTIVKTIFVQNRLISFVVK